MKNSVKKFAIKSARICHKSHSDLSAKLRSVSLTFHFNLAFFSLPAPRNWHKNCKSQTLVFYITAFFFFYFAISCFCIHVFGGLIIYITVCVCVYIYFVCVFSVLKFYYISSLRSCKNGKE